MSSLTQAQRARLAQKALQAGIAEAERILSGGQPVPNGKGTTRPDGSLLVSMTRIADRLGVWRTAVYNWSVRYADDWPEPLCGEGKHAVYWWPDIVSFLAIHNLQKF
jgi:hypothetical protein